MKKLLFMFMLFAIPSVHAIELGDYIKTTLLDNVTLSGLYGVRDSDQGAPKLAMTDSIIQIGRYKGSSLISLQAGFFGNTQEDTGEENAAVNWVFGGQFRLDPFVKERMPIQPTWEFLKSLQFGPAVFYDKTNHKWLPSLQVGLSFDLDPNIN